MSKDKNWAKLIEQLDAKKQDDNSLSSEEQNELTELKAFAAEISGAFELYQSIEVDQKWSRLREEAIAKGLLKPNDSYKTKIFRLWPRIAVAVAVAFLVFGAGILYYYKKTTFKNSNQTVFKNDIAPGQIGATLTLANGKKIRLNDAAKGELTRESGVSVSKLSNGQLVYEIIQSHDQSMSGINTANTLSTAKGETYQIRLPDGSLVWLNAASSLRYSAQLIQNGKRIVKLDGEAYFEIMKDKKHPFIVESKGQKVEVLGTHFNVNAYADEPNLATTLLEGSVKISTASNTLVILPGDQAINNSGKIRISKANIEGITDWKAGDFALNHMDFKTAMRKISRWYNVEIVYDVDIPDDLESGGWVSRNQNLSTVLSAIEATGLVRFRIDGRKIHVYK